MRIHIGRLADSLRCAGIVDKALVSTGAKSGKRANAMLERFNSLSLREKIDFLNASSALSDFCKTVVSEVGFVDIDVKQGVKS